ncbi:MAG: gamma-glutamyl-gamma-aminobutyrate hydrolase family protein [Myxococcales bacterium]|nr:gamma-glutamyl-gamma-aminobutyrate hydrolase family protein [Myxococcales bacterium]
MSGTPVVAGPRQRLLVININPDAATRNGTRRIARAFERLARLRVGGDAAFQVHIRHFRRLSLEEVARLGPTAVVLGPQGVPFDAYPNGARAHLFALIAALADSARPLLAICGGHQALVLSHGGAIGPVHGGRASGSYDGHTKETGLRRVRRVGDGGLVGAALDGDFVVSHVEGVTLLPSCFELIGEGEPCKVQAIRLRGRPVWGVQFHPERDASATPDGRRAGPRRGDGDGVLVAFLREAGLMLQSNDEGPSDPTRL